jgi:hypothetical protein
VRRKAAEHHAVAKGSRTFPQTKVGTTKDIPFDERINLTRFHEGNAMRRPLFLITAGGVAAGALIIATALPATAATSGRAETAAPAAPAAGPGTSEGTIVTFEVTSTGALGVTVPDGPVDLGSGAVGTTIGTVGNLGAVTVTDNRGLDPASWTASVSSTNFVNSVTAIDVIPAGDATYLTGTVAATPLQPLGSSAVSVHDTTAIALGTTTSGQSVVTETGFDGDNSTQWSPEILLAVPATAVLGTYDATITHSVS